MLQLRLRAIGCVLDILWPQTRKHDTLLIKSVGSHINPSECTLCVCVCVIVHLFESPIFLVKYGIICDKLRKVIYSWSVSGRHYNAENKFNLHSHTPSFVFSKQAQIMDFFH